MLAVLVSVVSSCSPQQAAKAPQTQSKTAEQPVAVSLFPPGFEESFFSGAQPLNEQTWRNQFAQDDSGMDLPAETPRHKLTLDPSASRMKVPSSVCRDFETNMNLYGGVHRPGCSVYPIHPDHPNRERFKIINWEPVSPIENFAVVRDRERDLCQRQLDLKKGTTLPAPQSADECWRNSALGYRRLLLENRLQMQRAMIDLDGKEPAEEVFRFAIAGRAACRSHDDSVEQKWFYAMLGRDHLANTFNATNEDGALFQYSGDLKATAYFWHPISPSGSLPGGYVTYGFSIEPADAQTRPSGLEYGHTQICAYR